MLVTTVPWEYSPVSNPLSPRRAGLEEGLGDFGIVELVVVEIHARIKDGDGHTLAGLHIRTVLHREGGVGLMDVDRLQRRLAKHIGVCAAQIFRVRAPDGGVVIAERQEFGVRDAAVADGIGTGGRARALRDGVRAGTAAATATPGQRQYNQGYRNETRVSEIANRHIGGV